MAELSKKKQIQEKNAKIKGNDGSHKINYNIINKIFEIERTDL